ncbi:MAG: D-alanyl-D-alanine carboxypeptidase family protein [Thermodesulfovibrionales bacterium]|nr:D-alanyl-D-alanine carboxypeptidase family protein [Thermodesulfovibrionales bacterium]
MRQTTEQQNSRAAEQQSFVHKSLAFDLLRYCATALITLFTIHYSLFTAYADEISSKAAVVMEVSTGRVLFAKNPNLKLPPASTTKLVTAMVVLDRANMSDTVTISEAAANVPSLKETKLRAGETLTVETLLYAALIRSANDAAFALAEVVAGSEKKFVQLMNRKTIAIGASHTKFINTTGLPGKGQHTTAYDLSKIMRYALKYPVIREIIGKKEAEIATDQGRTIALENTNRLLWSDNGAVGGKTGYTKAARHCFVYAGEKEGEMVIVALLGAQSREVLWNEAEKLETRGFAVIASNEQPVVYFTKADYKKSSKFKVKNSKLKTYSKNNKAKSDRVSSKKKINRAVSAKEENAVPVEEGKKTKDKDIAKNVAYGNKG